MKRFSLFALLLPMLLPALVAARESGQGPKFPSYAPAASVAGTTWVGTDSDGHYYEYHFQAGGALHYQSPTGFFKNGTWKQDGDAIYMEMNQKYAEYRGRISGKRMKGRASNVTGKKWTWEAEKRQGRP